VIVVDSDLSSENPEMIERYHMMCPQLFIIVLGTRDDLKDKYIEAGCNVYMHPLPLLSGIECLGNSEEKPCEEQSSESIRATPLRKGWRLSKMDYHLYTPSNLKIHLTTREFKFLELLFQCDNLVSKTDIEQLVTGGHCNTSDKRIAVMIARLRKKVQQQSSCLLPIKSDYTNGYVFAGQCFIEQLPEITAEELDSLLNLRVN